MNSFKQIKNIAYTLLNKLGAFTFNLVVKQNVSLPEIH